MASKDAPAVTAPVTSLQGVGPNYATKLANLNITSVRDLLHHYPKRFLDYRHQTPVKHIKAKTDVCFLARLSEAKRFITKNGKAITTVTASDHSGTITLTWFNNPYISRLLVANEDYIVAGKATFFGDKLTLIAPTLEPANRAGLHARGLVPIYPLTAGITSRFLRHKIKVALSQIPLTDPLTKDILKTHRLPGYADSLGSIHFPDTPANHHKADKRLAFNHHLAVNITNQVEIAKLPPSPSLTIDQTLHDRLTMSLPFKLTPGQKKAIAASYLDLTTNQYTHRLIQGETGSGKTMVAFFLAAQALAAKYSLCLLAPTEILATQHHQTFLKFGLPQGQVTLVTAKHPLQAEPIKPQVYIGTHALLTQLPTKLTHPLAAIIIDEQHKFGVQQRQELISRTPTPHLFNLTATPIPRSLALGLLGEVAISNLTPPTGRLPVKTWVMDQTRYAKSAPWLKSQLASGNKVFVVTPTISASGERSGAKKLFDLYKKNYAGHGGVFLIHGQMSTEDIAANLARFKAAKSGILVATTIIEVGVDITEANVIIIHHADNFGLATLHQLRGRVGRGSRQGYCLLITTSHDDEDNERLKLLEKYSSGLTLARMDLKLRGAGELFGERQHGWLPVRLKNFWNKELFQAAKAVARELINQDTPKALTVASRLASW